LFFKKKHDENGDQILDSAGIQVNKKCPQFLRRKKFSGQIAAINYARKGGNRGQLSVYNSRYI
jgi:hypothetical protein